MSFSFRGVVLLVAIALVMVMPLLAQQPGRPQAGRQPQPQAKNGKNNKADEVKIDDERLIELHRQFITSVEKLATEYEKKGELEKARHCYEQVIRLLPQYTPAKEKLDGVKTREATAEKKVIDIFANKEWQDTGLTVGEGKPVSIKATGTWKIRIDYDLGPDGVEIPPELRDFNIGALVGMIVTNPSSTDPKENPVFAVGSSKSFTASQTGRLFLRMYDAEPKDNVGKLSVEITGSFEKKGVGGT